MTKRLFVAFKIRPSSQLISVCQKLQLKLKNDRINWVALDNLHVTLKFLGETDDQLFPEIFNVLENVFNNFDRFRIIIKGIGRFSKRKHTKVIWLGIDDINNQLSLIADKLNHGLNLPIGGFDPEQKTFKAHLTFGRVKYIQNEHVLSDFINAYSNLEFQEITIDEIILYESVLKSRGPVYNSLKKIKLKD